jgi:hypothetical protein
MRLEHNRSMQKRSLTRNPCLLQFMSEAGSSGVVTHISLRYTTLALGHDDNPSIEISKNTPLNDRRSAARGF